MAEESQTATDSYLAMIARLEETAVELRQNEATYRALIDAMPTLAWTARADGHIDWYNRRWYEYTGTTPEQMEGWGWQSVHDERVLPDVLKRWKYSIESGQPFEMTFPLLGADRRFRAFLTRVVPLRDSDGRVIRWFGTNTDVESEVNIRRLVERLQSLTEALAAAETIDDAARVVVAETRDAMGARTGGLVVRPPGALEARIVFQTGLDDATVRKYATFPLDAPGPAAECLRTGKSIFIEMRDGPDGLLERFPELAETWQVMGAQALACIPMPSANDIVGAIAFTFNEPRAFSKEDRDFFMSLGRQCGQTVERARLFAAERAARERADDANRAKSQFLAMMSHELRTPLNAISGHVGLILEGIYGSISGEQKTALDRVLRAQAHLLGVINDVLSFARIESGRVEYHMDRLNLAEMAQSVLPMVEPQLARKGLRLAVNLPANRHDRPIFVMADEDKLAQILVNLLSNAVKFTNEGGLISIEVMESSEGGVPKAVIHVTDTGIGIPSSAIHAIFEPFMQVRPDLTRTREGTGLGLAISRDLARGMNAELSVVSEDGHGSTFTVSFPVLSEPA